MPVAKPEQRQTQQDDPAEVVGADTAKEPELLAPGVKDEEGRVLCVERKGKFFEITKRKHILMSYTEDQQPILRDAFWYISNHNGSTRREYVRVETPFVMAKPTKLVPPKQRR